MDPINNLRATPGQPFRPSASGFALLAEFAANSRRKKLGSQDGSLPEIPSTHRLEVRCLNRETSVSFDVGDVCTVGPRIEYPDIMNSDWLDLNRFFEVNDRLLMHAVLPSDPNTLSLDVLKKEPANMVGVFLEPCAPGRIGRVCIGGLCFARVAPYNFNVFADFAVGRKDYLTPPAYYAYGDPVGMGNGNFFVHLVSSSNPITYGSATAYNAIVEVRQTRPASIAEPAGIAGSPAYVKLKPRTSVQFAVTCFTQQAFDSTNAGSISFTPRVDQYPDILNVVRGGTWSLAWPATTPGGNWTPPPIAIPFEFTLVNSSELEQTYNVKIERADETLAPTTVVGTKITTHLRPTA